MPTTKAKPEPETAAPEEHPHGPIVASYGLRINMRQYDEQPTTVPPTLEALESLVEAWLSANFAGHSFVVNGERLDK